MSVLGELEEALTAWIEEFGPPEREQYATKTGGINAARAADVLAEVTRKLEEEREKENQECLD